MIFQIGDPWNMSFIQIQKNFTFSSADIGITILNFKILITDS